MAVPEAAALHYAEQQRVAELAVVLAVRAWLEQGDRSGSVTSPGWLRLRRQLYALLGQAQRRAAAGADPYMDSVLAETGQRSRRAAYVRAEGFAGVASDGRPLETLLDQVQVAVARAELAGVPEAEAFDHGTATLTRIVSTQIQDAGRTAVGVAIAAHPDLQGWVRMLNPPSCARCVILAGAVYRWNDGFERHPHCDCRHIPRAENVASDLVTDPKTYFRSLPAAEQDRIFTKAGARAIRDGADMIQVVNMRGVDRAGRRRFNRGRLMPEAIYEQAGDDRQRAMDLLRSNGYLLD